MATVETMTTDQMLAMQQTDGIARELIVGELRELPMTTSPPHAKTVARVSQILSNYLDAQSESPGTVFSGDGRFRILRDPDTTVGIDVAFVTAERLPPDQVPDRFVDMPPDLAIEVLSPSETQQEVDERLNLFLKAAVPLVWLVNPRLKTVTVVRSRTEMQLLTETGQLDGEPVLPGFTCKVAELFR
jgi:Uma2 family endonuclease